jgi:hypothetical protein
MLLASPIVLIAVPFWTVAFVVRVCSHLFVPPSESWEGIIEFNEDIGWKPKPNLDAYCSFSRGIFRVKTDSQGWRGKGDLSQCQVLVLGDSFAFGYGVDHDDAYFCHVGSGLQIKAVGSPGYNMAQEVLWLERLNGDLQDKLIVWFICLGNDLYDNLIPNHNRYRAPFVGRIYGTDQWEVVTKHLSSAEWPCTINYSVRRKEKWVATFTASYLGRRAYSACEFVIKKGNEICIKAGARLVVITIPIIDQFDATQWRELMSQYDDPSSFDADLPDREIGRICAELDIPFVAGKSHFEIADHIPGDGHWNKRGQIRMAQLLEKIYHEHRLEKQTVVTGNESQRQRLSLGRPEHSTT